MPPRKGELVRIVHPCMYGAEGKIIKVFPDSFTVNVRLTTGEELALDWRDCAPRLA